MSWAMVNKSKSIGGENRRGIEERTSPKKDTDTLSTRENHAPPGGEGNGRRHVNGGSICPRREGEKGGKTYDNFEPFRVFLVLFKKIYEASSPFPTDSSVDSRLRR